MFAHKTPRSEKHKPKKIRITQGCPDTLYSTRREKGGERERELGSNMEEVLVYLMKIMLVSLVLFVFVLKVVVLLWWRPRKIEDHFSKQGIRGPPYRFFIGNAKELVSLMLKASSQPMPLSHNILPRVLSFYHHWRKIYGTSLSLPPFSMIGNGGIVIHVW